MNKTWTFVLEIAAITGKIRLTGGVYTVTLGSTTTFKNSPTTIEDRVFMGYETNSIRDNAVVTGASYTFRTGTITTTGTVTPRIQLYGGSWLGTDLDQADWSMETLGTSLETFPGSGSLLSNTTYTHTFTAGELPLINLTDHTDFGLRDQSLMLGGSCTIPLGSMSLTVTGTVPPPIIYTFGG